MPVSVAALIRAVIIGALSLHAFLMYSFALDMSGTFGFDLGSRAKALLFAIVLMIPFVWAFGLADLPDLHARYIRPHRRWRRGLCPGCGYDLRAIPSEDCPECGRHRIAPASYQYQWRTVRRFVLFVLLSLAIGCGASEVHRAIDERAFINEVETAGRQAHSRPRRWPSGDAMLIYVPTRGFSATD